MRSRRVPCGLALALLAWGGQALAAQATPSPQELAAQVRALTTQMQSMQAQLDSLRAQLAKLAPPGATAPGDIAGLEDRQAETEAKVDEQYQTKVESGSRYRVQMSGMVLLNLYANQGAVNNSDVPNLAQPRAAGSTGGDLGGSLRQSQFGLSVSGPTLWGARTSGNLETDFFGGFPPTTDGSAGGILRLRTAAGRLDWSHTAFFFGQDNPFITPLAPTSYASVAIPSLGFAGNLWNWIPQVGVEHDWMPGAGWRPTLALGLLDPVDGQTSASTFGRKPEAGESSRQPALEARTGLNRTAWGRSFEVGIGGYESRQNYGFGRTVDGWAGTADWKLPLLSWLELSGEGYRGAAIGGIWGAEASSIVSNGAVATGTTLLSPLHTEGGWSQLKVKATTQLEFNAALGQDNPFARDVLRYAPAPGSLVSRNQSAMLNAIDHPRSDLVVAFEVRRLDTSYVAAATQTAWHYNLALGILF